ELDEQRFLKQKAKVKWLKDGDSNTTYFYRIVKSKCTKNKIDMVSDSSNTLYDGNQVPCAFVNHYDQFLGTKGVTNHLDDHDLYTRVLKTTKTDFMVRDVTDIKRGLPRCAFKVNIQKAYDMVDWKFFETILGGFGFHPKMVKWIMVCVSGASNSICVNGNLYVGLRCRVGKSDEFQYHHHCEQQRIINMCFEDDLFLFARGHPNSVFVIMGALEEFKQVLYQGNEERESQSCMEFVVRCHGVGGNFYFLGLLSESLFGRVLVMETWLLCGSTSDVLLVPSTTSFHLVILLELVSLMLLRFVIVSRMVYGNGRMIG
nr:hypothetical protein [Tanacetum cinerariifolium]